VAERCFAPLMFTAKLSTRNHRACREWTKGGASGTSAFDGGADPPFDGSGLGLELEVVLRQPDHSRLVDHGSDPARVLARALQDGQGPSRF
jgi:hypothetical protein